MSQTSIILKTLKKSVSSKPCLWFMLCLFRLCGHVMNVCLAVTQVRCQAVCTKNICMFYHMHFICGIRKNICIPKRATVCRCDSIIECCVFITRTLHNTTLALFSASFRHLISHSVPFCLHRQPCSKIISHFWSLLASCECQVTKWPLPSTWPTPPFCNKTNRPYPKNGRSLVSNSTSPHDTQPTK